MKKLSDLNGTAFVKATHTVWEILKSVFPILNTEFDVWALEVLADNLGITFDDNGNIIR